MNLRENATSYLFILPFLIIFVAFLGYPIFYSLYLSFHKVVDLYDVFGGMKYVGLHNFVKLFKDVEFGWSILITFYYAVLLIPMSLFISFVLAILLNNRLRGARVFRSAYFLPFVLDVFVVAIVWRFLYSSPYGVIIKILNTLHIHMPPPLGTPSTALPSIAIAMALKNAGLGMILFLAGLQNIPQSIYEASAIDGASTWRRHIDITLPLLRPIILFLVVTGMIGVFSAFAEFYGMTDGGPWITFHENTLGMTKATGLYLFRQFESLKLGYAAAISFILLIITIIISFISMRLLRQRT